MAEGKGPEEPQEAETPRSGPEAGAAAVALAMAHAGKDKGKAFGAVAAEFLAEQTRVLRLQSEHLHEERELHHRHLALKLFGDRLRIGLQLLGIVAGLAVVAFLGAMAWNAHEDRGVVIEAFSVPPDLAQRGLTGQVVASELLDRLSQLEARTVTGRPASTYANDWGQDIKVEIPETGVSIGELNRYLTQWLGGETRISGEIVRTPTGLALAARAGDTPAGRFTGPEGDLDALLQRTAEAVYARTQPYRYAAYLASTGRQDQALAAYQRISQSGSREDRPWAYAAWAALAANTDPAGAASRAREALALGAPPQSGAISALLIADFFSSHWEALLADARQMDKAYRQRPGTETAPLMMGDYRSVTSLAPTADNPLEGQAGGAAIRAFAIDLHERAHDLAGAYGFAERAGFPRGFADVQLVHYPNGFALLGDQDWPRIEAAVRASTPTEPRSLTTRGNLAALAVAVASQGRQAEAEALVAATPLDCDTCIDARAVIAARRGDWPAAQRWLTILETRTPSVPFAPAEFGKLLLDRGETDAAIAKFRTAHRISPHFADPLEFWGEALMKTGDFKDAAAKFAEADRSTPRWGRNHLNWGEALMLSGRYAEARRQYEIASGLDLSKPERAALKVLLDRTARGPLRG